MDNTFILGGVEFKVRKVNPFKQLHIARRIAPILGELLPVMKKSGALKGGMKAIENLPEAEKLSMVGEFLSPILMGTSKLSDADTEFVLLGLLEAVERKQPQGNYAKLVNDNMLMFQDMELGTMINLAGRAFMFNLAGFFGVLPH